MKNTKSTVTVKAVVAILFSFAMVFPTTTTAVSAQSADRTYQSEEDSFRLQVPQGWVIQDDVIDFDTIALLCQENEALPGIGGTHNCQAANITDGIFISRWPDLQSMPEFQNLSSPITTNDLVALWIQQLQNDTSRIKIVNNTDIDEFTKFVDTTYIVHSTAGTILPLDDYDYNVTNSNMFVLSQDRNTGYHINRSVSPDFNETLQSPALQEVFSSFEILE